MLLEGKAIFRLDLNAAGGRSRKEERSIALKAAESRRLGCGAEPWCPRVGVGSRWASGECEWGGARKEGVRVRTSERGAVSGRERGLCCRLLAKYEGSDDGSAPGDGVGQRRSRDRAMVSREERSSKGRCGRIFFYFSQRIGSQSISLKERCASECQRGPKGHFERPAVCSGDYPPQNCGMRASPRNT